jgi:hypothetical protein
MPREIRSSEGFEKLLVSAQECRVVRQGGNVKLKLRTPEYLYVYKTTSDEADDLLKRVKDVEVVEMNPVSDKKSKKTRKGEEEKEQES